MSTFTAHTILITGGATGIGLALAKRLSGQGNHVIVCGRSDAALERAQQAVPDLITRTCDITDPVSRHAMIEWLAYSHPALDTVINNAGVQHKRDFTTDPAIQTLDQEVAINFTAPVHLITELLPQLRKHASAFIVNVTSGLAFSPMADVPVYCASKAAMHSFTVSLRHQLKSTGIRVIELAPPIVDTGLGGQTRSEGTVNSNMMSAAAFADEAVAQLEAGNAEILVGLSANTRKMGEALFDRMNGRG